MSARRAPGFFITLEGIEGVGKTTQLKRLSCALSARAVSHVVTREPGGTPLAEQIRMLVLGAGEEVVPDVAELLLVFAARSVHLENFIEPNLAAGYWVLCDRFTDSTYAYQGGGRGLQEPAIRSLERLVQGQRRPDLTLLIDVPVALGLERATRQRAAAGRSADRFDAQRAEFFERVRAMYLERLAAEPDRIALIDGRPDAEAVSAQILEVLRSRSWIP